MCITTAKAQFKINTHRCEIDTCAFQTDCQLSSTVSGMSVFGIVFLHNYCGTKSAQNMKKYQHKYVQTANILLSHFWKLYVDDFQWIW